ncbi:MAG TPA: L-seryl-tRNA(Sec) selenium transferase [Opitutaceae bacterium]|nr:L-seryl-tRNA(Sec) selenium transferase [Opitutaceae bacterium]
MKSVADAASGTTDVRRTIPSVERVMAALGDPGLPRVVAVAEIRRTIDAMRRAARAVDFDAVVACVRKALATLRRQRLQPVINGTGIVLHTNFGRAPLSAAALRALREVGENYSNLEFNLESGQRGGRAAFLEQALAQVVEAETATVVNNGAAALVLVVRHLTVRRREVVLSRGEMVQIGGGFRIPEILEASGAVVREVGTTNQTSLDDYARAIRPETALILRVHRSNFFMEGFVASPPTSALAGLARGRGIPLVEDLGSGAVWATETIAGVEHEPTIGETLRQGVDLVICSGDKLLGGPQAGIIAGKSALVAALKRDPLFRALRCDKLVFAALEATIEAHLSGAAAEQVPVLAMLGVTTGELRERAEAIVNALAARGIAAGVTPCVGEVGGGSLPRSQVPSVAVELLERVERVEDLAKRLRHGTPPVIGRIERGRVQFDLRTVFPRQDEALIAAVGAAVMPNGQHREETTRLRVQS